MVVEVVNQANRDPLQMIIGVSKKVVLIIIVVVNIIIIC